MFSKRIISMLVVLSFISQTLVVVDTDSYSSAVVEDYSILEELSEQDGARTSPSNLSIPFTDFAGGTGSCMCHGTWFSNGQIIIFAAESNNATYGGGGKGQELYVSDGTLTGTSMIKDLNPGLGDINGALLNSYNSHVWWNDVLYLALDDGTDETGQELWRTDATAAGTYLIKDITEGSGSSSISGLTLWEDHLYFAAKDGSSGGNWNGTELWQSDGTENGTFMLKDIDPGFAPNGAPLSSYPKYFTVFNNKLYFQATDEENGAELWTTDGTENGTTLAVDIYPGVYGNGKGKDSSPYSFTVFNDYMYFSATNETVSNGLWKSDGTANGTSQVKNIWPDGTSNVRSIVSNLDATRQTPNKFAIMGDNLYFTAKDTCTSSRCLNLWKSDGTEDGTVRITDFEDEDDTTLMMNSVGGVVGESKMVFVVDTEEYGEELWVTDGTTEGTHLVKDINPDGDSEIYSAVAGSGDIFYFGARDGNGNGHPSVLWKTDGTEEGTIKVNSTAINGRHPDKIGYNGWELLRFGDHLIFPAFTGSGSGGACAVGCGEQMVPKMEPTWLSSGFSPSPSYSVYENEVLEPITFDYAEAYREEMVYKGSGNLSKITNIGGSSSSNPDDIVVIDDIAYFTASSSEYGEELWRTDGTESGVALVKDIHPGSTGSEINHGLVKFKDSILFSANDGTHGEELWISDGTENGTFMLKDMDEGDGSSDSDPYGFLDAGDFAYFSGSDDSDDRELWKTDGTTNGTVRVKNIVSDGSSNPGQLTLFGDTVFFTVGDGISSTLWKANGTEEGTIEVSSSVSNIGELNVMGDALYFRGTSSGNDRELWKTDGTTAGTVRVKDINPGNAGSVPGALTVAGGTLFFNADDGINGGELWKSDGTEDGTVLVKDIRSGGSHSNIIEMVSIGNIVYFRADDGNIGRELWRSDGTEEGTYLLKDIWTGWESSDPQSFTPIGDRLFFRAEDGDSGHELWISDGTESGTVMIENITNNENDSDPMDFTKVGNHIVFSAAADWNDRELWSFDPTEILYHSIEGMHWSISPSLPEGLSLDSSTGKITGIPTEVIDWTDYKVTLTASNPETGSYFYNGDGSTSLLKDIYLGDAYSRAPLFPVVMNGIAYFGAINGTNGNELWRTDGTEDGTYMVKDIYSGSSSGFRSDFNTRMIVFNDNVFFWGNNGTTGVELWKSDGTEEGTVFVKELTEGSGDTYASGPFTIFNDELYFIAKSPDFNKYEIFKTDGTE
ncbi:putative Ig domain-containing protein, partial [Marine Group III euryarchaeote]|nr:putative Ig domain-containing protein [Marine Group III euryarchaeote]